MRILIDSKTERQLNYVVDNFNIIAVAIKLVSTPVDKIKFLQKREFMFNMSKEDIRQHILYYGLDNNYWGFECHGVPVGSSLVRNLRYLLMETYTREYIERYGHDFKDRKLSDYLSIAKNVRTNNRLTSIEMLGLKNSRVIMREVFEPVSVAEDMLDVIVDTRFLNSTKGITIIAKGLSKIKKFSTLSSPVAFIISFILGMIATRGITSFMVTREVLKGDNSEGFDYSKSVLQNWLEKGEDVSILKAMGEVEGVEELDNLEALEESPEIKELEDSMDTGGLTISTDAYEIDTFKENSEDKAIMIEPYLTEPEINVTKEEEKEETITSPRPPQMMEAPRGLLNL